MAGNDILSGVVSVGRDINAEGSDILNGGTGNNTYGVDGLDIITEAANGGIDTVLAVDADRFILGDKLENLDLSFITEDANGTGNNLNNTITGSEPQRYPQWARRQ